MAKLAISGSAGMGMAEGIGVPFVQEVFATRVAANRLAPGTDCIIELGGEDAKILFLTGAMEVRMNGSCAGGTGAFIDQMATLLKLSAEELNTAAQKAEKTYTIASRCGVFAKSDIQPLINQGARTEDIAASIYQAVVNQTIARPRPGQADKGQGALSRRAAHVFGRAAPRASTGRWASAASARRTASTSSPWARRSTRTRSLTCARWARGFACEG